MPNIASLSFIISSLSSIRLSSAKYNNDKVLYSSYSPYCSGVIIYGSFSLFLDTFFFISLVVFSNTSSTTFTISFLFLFGFSALNVSITDAISSSAKSLYFFSINFQVTIEPTAAPVTKNNKFLYDNFGHYWQDAEDYGNEATADKEPIEWRILATKSNPDRTLIVSKKTLLEGKFDYDKSVAEYINYSGWPASKMKEYLKQLGY